MHNRRFAENVWSKRTVLLVSAGLVFAGGYMTALWLSPHPSTFAGPAQAATQQQEQHHETHDIDLAPFMIRNAYHFATFYHAARAGRWELAEYQLDELDENLQHAAQAAAAIYAPLLNDYRKDFVPRLQQAVAARNTEQFHIAFRAAVDGCNDCHKATNHAFITIPQEPPSLSIFVLPPSGG
jgi:hypothetical protein